MADAIQISEETAGAAQAVLVPSLASGCPATEPSLFEPDDAPFEDHSRANWSVPWSDLMMTMFVLFAVLLGMQSARDRTPEAAAAGHRPAMLPAPPAGVREVERIVERPAPVVEREPVEVPVQARDSEDPYLRVNVLARSEEAARETNLQNAEIVLLEDQSVKVSVQGPMFFALGRADLRPQVMRFLDRLAQIMRETPYEIRVIGHTDDLPIRTAEFPSNWELSLRRASQVARYLIKAGGLQPARFIVMGRGEYAPAAANDEERSRALNRRVEIIITRNIGLAERGDRS